MNRRPAPNIGDRPSRLQLARYHLGEGDPAERAAVEAWIAANGSAWLDELALAEAPPFDAADLRARARRQAQATGARSPANRVRWSIFAAIAAVTALSAAPLLRSPADAPTTPDVRFRGGGLEVHWLQAGQLVPYARGPLAAGDVIGFRLPPGPEATIALLSVDGAGTTSVYFGALRVPASAAPRPLPSSLTLDDAPGPEVFVAAYDTPVSVAVAAAEAAWVKGGADAVLAWADAEASVDAARVERR